MKSLWTESAERPTFDELRGDIKTDVLIIGGGMAGILTAYMLERAGVDYVLCEADRICGGTTANTTAKITSQHGLIYDKLTREFGLERAAQYLRANEAALAEFREICKDIDCDFRETDNYVYSVSDRKKLEDEMAALEKIGYAASLESEVPLPIEEVGAVRFGAQAQFHPLKFAFALARPLRIFEHTKITELADGCAWANGRRITAEKIIVATHFPILNKHGMYFVKLYQSRSYVLALRGAPEVDGMFVDEAEKGMSFRNSGDMLLIGGGDHRTGKRGGAWRELELFAAHNWGDAEIVHRWAAQDCMSLDGVPYIGQYSKSTPNLYVASGFNKWGMSSAMVSARILSDLVQGRANDCAEVFSPQRTLLRPQLAVNAAETVMNLITPTAPRCPHLGCALKYNKEERSWDCPCHGSRFGESGELLEGPATDDMKRES